MDKFESFIKTSIISVFLRHTLHSTKNTISCRNAHQKLNCFLNHTLIHLVFHQSLHRTIKRFCHDCTHCFIS